MMIDRIGGVNPLNNVQTTRRVNNTSSVSMGEDSISVSQEAKGMAEAYFLSKVASETPDIREDLVAQVKEKIKNPNYINSAVMSSVADRIMSAYGL